MMNTDMKSMNMVIKMDTKKAKLEIIDLMETVLFSDHGADILFEDSEDEADEIIDFIMSILNIQIIS